MKLRICLKQNIPNEDHSLFEYHKKIMMQMGGFAKNKQKFIENINKYLTSDTKSIYINQYNLFVGLSKISSTLKNRQTYLYHT